MANVEDLIVEVFEQSGIIDYDSSVMLDPNLTIMHTSYNRQGVVGYGDEVIGTNYLDYVCPYDTNYIQDHFNKGIEITLQFQLQHKQKGYIVARSTIIPLTEHGAIYGYMVLTKRRDPFYYPIVTGPLVAVI